MKKRYYGETSRSPHQRGNEHSREVREGVASHPLITHFREEYNGAQQDILIWVLSKHITPLDRQVKGSLNTTRASRCAEECLNIKT